MRNANRFPETKVLAALSRSDLIRIIRYWTPRDELEKLSNKYDLKD
jgi:hypothetical protein